MSSEKNPLLKTARTTGIWYLLLAISGVIGFMVLNPQIFVSDNPEKTLANLTDHEGLARSRLIAEFFIVLSQSLAAIWFYKLFKKVDEWSAWSIGILGTVNAIVILISAISIASAISISNSTMDPDNQIMMIELLSYLSANAWGAGSLFFGLWLIPMGYVITISKTMPVWLGRMLIIGGIGYILSTILNYSGLDYSVASLFTIPATVGEFWMIGYLLIFGIRPENQPQHIATD